MKEVLIENICLPVEMKKQNRKFVSDCKLFQVYPFLINYIPHVPDCLRIEFHGWIGLSLGWSAGPVHSFPLLHGWIGSSFG